MSEERNSPLRRRTNRPGGLLQAGEPPPGGAVPGERRSFSFCPDRWESALLLAGRTGEVSGVVPGSSLFSSPFPRVPDAALPAQRHPHHDAGVRGEQPAARRGAARVAIVGAANGAPVAADGLGRHDARGGGDGEGAVAGDQLAVAPGARHRRAGYRHASLQPRSRASPKCPIFIPNAVSDRPTNRPNAENGEKALRGKALSVWRKTRGVIGQSYVAPTGFVEKFYWRTWQELNLQPSDP